MEDVVAVYRKLNEPFTNQIMFWTIHLKYKLLIGMVDVKYIIFTNEVLVNRICYQFYFVFTDVLRVKMIIL